MRSRAPRSEHPIKKFTPEDLARILCAVDPRVMDAANQLRILRCATTMETLAIWLEIIDFLVGFIPGGPLWRIAIRASIQLTLRLLKRLT